MENKDIFKKFFEVAKEHMGERAAYENADIQRDMAIEQLLIKKGVLTKQEIEDETAKNMLGVIEYIEKKNIKSPFSQK